MRVTGVAEAVQLFVSLISTTLLWSSAQASRKYVLSGVEVGIVTTTVPDWLAPGARAATARLPDRSLSPASLVLLSDRLNRVDDDPETTAPRFWVVLATENLPPGTAVAGGADTALTVRSGLVTVTMAPGVAVQLFPSPLSAIALRSSAQASRK